MRLNDQRCLFGITFPEKIQGTRHAAGIATRTFGTIYIQSHKELLSLVSDAKILSKQKQFIICKKSPMVNKAGRIGLLLSVVFATAC
jgi:hypothetical protein